MRKFLSAAIFSALSAVPAYAIDAAIQRQLNALAPEERLEQRCDMEAMERIAAERKGMRPDKVIAYAFGASDAGANAISAPGAVFRSGGKWYRLRYKCKIAAKSLEVLSFDYKVGEQVPQAQWRKHFLYN